MAGDVLIAYLPNELLEHILGNNVLTFRDITNFGTTCRKFRNLVYGSNKLWKTKFQQLWPGLENVYDSERTCTWRDEFIRRYSCGCRVRQLVAEMSSKFYRKDEISDCDLIYFDALLQDHEYANYFVTNELMLIVNDEDYHSNLTQKFYTEKILRYVRQRDLTRKWHHLKTLPSEDLTLEKGAVLAAQWSQPLVGVLEEDIANRFDEIADRVKSDLYAKNSGHPLFKVPPEISSQWRVKNIPDNFFKPAESRQVLDCLRIVLFGQMGFHGNNEMYYNFENSLINKVLELQCGIPITLSIVYESIARRLGVKCEPVNLPAHFLLRWQGTYITREEPSTYYYIDVFNGGQFLTKRDCPHYTPDSVCPMKERRMPPATFAQVVDKIANNLEVAGRQRSQGREARLRSALELIHLVSPSDMNCAFHLSRFYMLHHMNLGGLIGSLEKMQGILEGREKEQANNIIKMMKVYESHHYNREEFLTEIESKPRASEVVFAVGMIMRHLRYDYICVIYGWDPLCNASQEWINQMGVDNLPSKDHQPFYNVLVEDGSTRYVAQENLEVAPRPIVINHVDVGRFFQEFCGTYYIPNREKEEEYPQDAEVRMQILNVSRMDTQHGQRELPLQDNFNS